jgi:predicted metal-dependent enzyme (double-stranded beta helix superfamily)
MGAVRTDELVAALRTAADEPGFGPERAAAVLDRAVAGGADWLDPRYQQIPDGEDSALYPLHRDPGRRWSVVAAVFRPGVPTTVHDHGTWAAIGVCRGVERETWLRRSGDGPLEQVRSFDSAAGSVRVVPDGTIHTVEALGGVDAVSVHVYGTDIVTQRRSAFDVATGAQRPYSPELTPAD